MRPFDTPVLLLQTRRTASLDEVARRRAGRATTSSSSASSTTRSPRTRRCASNFNREQYTRPAILGVGGYDLIERGYATEDDNNTLRIQEAGPLGRRFFINTRASINWADSSSRTRSSRARRSACSTSSRAGGQQRKGGATSKTINLQSDLDYVRGIHSVRTGFSSTAARTIPTTRSNYLGTYTFESLDAFSAGTPRSFTHPHRRPEHRLQERSGRHVPAGRHPRPEEPHGQPRRPLRAADAPVGLQQLRTAVRRHLVAGQERQDDAARQRRHLLRLAVDRHLRADAARGRLPPARGEHHQSAVPEPGDAAGTGSTDEPLPARRRPADAALHPASARASTGR